MESESTDGQLRHFRHPFLQACGMFLGEMMCMVAFYILNCYKERKRQRELVSIVSLRLLELTRGRPSNIKITKFKSFLS